jgi:chromosome segregation ATPase
MEFVLTDFFGDVQGLQLESADRLAAKQRAEKELAIVQEANKGLQAVAAKAEEARQGLVPAGELVAARSALGAAEQRIADLERELREAREEASSADGRAKAAIAAAEEDRKVSEVLIAGLQDDHTSLQCFITGLARPLLGECIFPF